jgi:2-iminobutanoate/2-iminopropanoate deaminase
MRRTKINPWTNPIFHDAGVLVEGSRRLLFLNGQCAVSPEGQSLHPGDMRAQMMSALDNLETVLEQAGMDFSKVVWMNTYVTDIDVFNEHVAEPLAERLARFDARPPGVLSCVTALGRPELLIELQMIAAD